MDQDNKVGPPVPDEAPESAARREALRKLAFYGAYTPPALIAILESRQAQAQSLPR